MYVGVPRDEGAGEKEREDAIKAVDEACDESQQLRVRQETARIVRKYSFVPVWISFFHRENGSLYVSGKLPTYPSPKPTFLWEVSVCVGGGGGWGGKGANWAFSQKRMMTQIEKNKK